MTHDAFLQAIIENPDDDAPRLVYADFLEERGDHDRAQFIRCQCELAHLPANDARRSELEATQSELLGKHEHEWADEIPRRVIRLEFRRGFVDSIDVPAKGFSHTRMLVSLAPIRRLHIVGTFRSGKPSFQTIAGASYLSRLSSLTISRAYYHLNADALETLANSPFLANLSGLHVQDAPVGYEGMKVLTRSPLRLTELSLSGYGFNREDFVSVEGVRALVGSSMCSRLTYLALCVNGVGDQGCSYLASASLQTLRHLVLVGNSIGEAGAFALLDSPRLSGLETLDLRKNYLSLRCEKRLRLRFGDRVLL